MRSSIVAIATVLLASCSGGGGSANQQAATGNAATPGGGGGGSGLSLQPGQWELRTEVVRMNVPNMPAGMSPPMPPPTTVRYCLTAAQASQPNANFLTGSGESGGCRSENMSVAGGHIQGSVVCSNEGTNMRSDMTGQFTPASYEISQRVHTSAQGMEMDMESRTTGRRTGDCPG